MKRVVCVWFPNWPMQRHRVEHPDDWVRTLLVADERGQQWVVACSPDAERRGVRPGMRVAEARALCDEIRSLPYDAVADRTALEALARWSRRFSPTSGVDGEDGLLLDATGCPHLHGGERPMLHDVHHALVQRGFRPRLAMADTIGLAWASCRYGESTTTLLPHRSGLAAIRRLPVESLRLDSSIVRTLHELGVTTVDRLERLPRSTLPARFGTEIARRLDEASGERPEAVEPIPPRERLHESRSFESPLRDREHVEQVVVQLLEPSLERLRSRREGVVRLEIVLDLDGGDPVGLTIGCLHGVDSVDRLRQLVGLRLERVELSEGVNGVGVEVVDRAPIGWRGTTLFPDDERRVEYADLVERLSQRLGDRSVLRPRLVADAQPERAVRFVPALRDGVPSEEGTSVLGRPLSLLPSPVPVTVHEDEDGSTSRFPWQGRMRVVTHHWGPERIATGWWRGPSVRRDYYRVQTADGQLFWLFRCLSTEQWFLHGCFD